MSGRGASGAAVEAVCVVELGEEASPVWWLPRWRRSREGVCDVLLEDAAGRPLATFRGVETILRPGEAVVREGAPAGVPS